MDIFSFFRGVTVKKFAKAGIYPVYWQCKYQMIAQIAPFAEGTVAWHLYSVIGGESSWHKAYCVKLTLALTGQSRTNALLKQSSLLATFIKK
jgi:hypothetical protein